MAVLFLAAVSTQAAQTVIPASGETAFIEVSAAGVNRLIFPEEVAKAIASQEKGVSAQISGRDVFLKFTRPQAGNVDVYFLGASGQVYSLILVPKDLPAETVVVKGQGRDRLETAKLEASLPYETTLKNLIRAAYTETPPQGYTEVKADQEARQPFRELRETHLKTFRGELYEVRESLLRNVTNAAVQLSEESFITDEHVLAVALESLELKPQAETRLFVVSQVEDQAEDNDGTGR
ncbi:MAG: type-F conjugative transfer system secretin TraK [Pseudomonadota bacterium]